MDSRRSLIARVTEFALVIGALVLAAAPISQGAVERWFSTGWYPIVQRALTPIANVLPIAWFDLLTLSAVAWLVWIWWRALRAGVVPRRRRAARAAWRTLVAASLVYLMFLLLWGLNYRRVSMDARLDVDPEPPSTADVVALGREAADRLNALYGFAHVASWEPAPWRNEILRAAFADVQRLLADAPPSVPGRLKRSLYGPFFRWTSVDGMINPFGLEVIANPDLLPFERPFVAAHEWAHLAGYADESEASFVGWLTCLRADAPSRYSAWLYVYWQVSGELPAAERAAIAAELAPGPRADLEAIAARLRRGSLPLLRRVSWGVYDRYLKANRVESGVRSYGEVVTLILRARFEDGWRPVRRASGPAPSS